MERNGEGFATHTRCVYPLQFFFFLSRRLRTRKAGMIPLTDFLLISPAFLSALVSPAPFFSRDRFSFFPFFFTNISCLKAENWSKLVRACEINSSFVSWKTHPSSSPYFSSFFRFASFLHSARSCRQQSDQGWKLGPGGSAP